METVDWIIASVGVVAIIATTLGVVLEDELVGEQDIAFVTGERDQGGFTGESFTTSLDRQVQAGDNATAAVISVDVAFTGTSVNPDGDATVRVEVVMPNNTVSDDQTKTLPIPEAPGGTGGSVSFTFDLSFLDLPMNTTSTDVGAFDATHTWEDPYQIRITVTSPADLLGTTTGQASYTYDADIAVTESFYSHFVRATDIEGGA